MSMLSVLSVNTFIMGHAAYQLGLERGFAANVPDVNFESVHLPRANRSDLVGRIAYRLLTGRLSWRRDRDWDWHRLRSEVASSLFLRRLLQREMPVRQPDVLHVHTQSIALLSSDILRSVPSVVSLDCTTALIARLHPAPAQRTYRPIIRLERACLAAASQIVCWSATARKSVIEDYQIDPDRVSVVRPAVARHLVPPRRAQKPGPRRFRLLFVGNDFERKGGHDLVAVFREHLEGDCELDIVSNGIDALPSVDGLRLHKGLVSNSPALRQLYADADAFVMPTYEDAFGLVYVEAMAAGLPCIGSDVLAVPELVQHGVTGLTLRAGDRGQLRAAIESLRDDPALRERLAVGARTFVETECDEATNCQRLAAIFRMVATNQRTPAVASVPVNAAR